MSSKAFAAFASAALLAATLSAQPAAPAVITAIGLPAGISSPALGLSSPPPGVSARAVAVVDAATGTILFAKNPDLAIPPASLTKLVTLHLVYEEIHAGRLSKDEMVEVDRRDCSPLIPYGSSLMYLRPGMRVSVIDLMRGAAVVSGNDAAFTLARRVAGSNEAFAARMNQTVRAMGFKELYFVEPSGLSELNRVTAAEFARFCRRYVELHPESLAELHSLRYIEFPRQEHATSDYVPEGRIIQYNRNNLVLSYAGCDGLKTGYIIESGYNLAATASRNGTRFVIVMLGGTGEDSALGGVAQRSRDGSALLDWSFASFRTAEPPLGPLPRPRVWYGVRREVALVPTEALAVTLSPAQAASLSVRIQVQPWVDASVAKGLRLGEVVYSSGGRVVRRVDLVAERDIPRGNLFVLVRDAIAKFFTRLFGLP